MSSVGLVTQYWVLLWMCCSLKFKRIPMVYLLLLSMLACMLKWLIVVLIEYVTGGVVRHFVDQLENSNRLLFSTLQTWKISFLDACQFDRPIGRPWKTFFYILGWRPRTSDRRLVTARPHLLVHQRRRYFVKLFYDSAPGDDSRNLISNILLLRTSKVSFASTTYRHRRDEAIWNRTPSDRWHPKVMWSLVGSSRLGFEEEKWADGGAGDFAWKKWTATDCSSVVEELWAWLLVPFVGSVKFHW